jgi:hypothetical protein
VIVPLEEKLCKRRLNPLLDQLQLAAQAAKGNQD